MSLISRIFNGKNGFSLIEILVSLGILGTLAIFVVKGTDFINKQATSVKADSQGSEVVSSLASKILGNATSYQINYSNNNVEKILQNSKFKMAWDLNGEDAPIAQCDKCKGRYGIIVKPLTDFKGIYKVTVILEHPSFKKDDNDNHQKRFERLVGH